MRAMTDMQYRSLDTAIPQVSVFSLGSWNTWSRVPFEQTVSVLARALELGINLFDIAYYWDKPHTEVIFGRALQVVGAQRERYLLAEKLWLWDYPQQSFRAQLEGALTRLGVEYIDIAMVSRPLPGMEFERFCDEVIGLIDLGLVRAWGVTNWDASMIVAAHDRLQPLGRPLPRLVQLQYNVARRSVVESSEYRQMFATTPIRLCAAHTMEGGILAGHLQRNRVDPVDFAAGKVPHERNIARDAGGIREQIRDRYRQLEAIATEFSATPAQIALAFCLCHPAIATVLFGVTRQENLEENIRALDLLKYRDQLLAAVAPLSIAQVAHPQLFTPHASTERR